MEVLLSFSVALFGCFALAVPVHAQNQTGFISIDCGILEGTTYIDKRTGIGYVSDSTYADTGIKGSVSPEFHSKIVEQQFLNVRSFPYGSRNCYTLKLQQAEANKYLIRARFMYGNYDGKNRLPEFDLHLGVHKWDLVKLEGVSSITTKEIIHVLTSNLVHVCLINTGFGTPFISALELRPLNNSMYPTEYGSLLNILRYDFGSTTGEFIRYKDDAYDRIWTPPTDLLPSYNLSTQFPINCPNHVPLTVMQTAITPLDNSSLSILTYKPDSPQSQLYFYLYFADVAEHKINQSRKFNIYLNGRIWSRSPPIVLSYLGADIRYTITAWTFDGFEISIKKSENSTLPPIISAVEAYVVKYFPQVQTEEEEAYALRNIKLMYAITKNWQGDPCGPKAYSWDGVGCSYDDDSALRIISLNFSSCDLSGEILSYLFSLTMIQYLDLSNNGLTGPVPAFLSKLKFLKTLNLAGNNLTGSVPAELIERSKNGSLSLSVDANVCVSLPCNNSNKINDIKTSKSSKKLVLLVMTVVATTSSFLLGALIILWHVKRREQVRKMRILDGGSNQADGPFESKKKQFSYSEVLAITHRFENVIGRGGFGIVYHGYLDCGTQVAVKMVLASSIHGYEQFKTEAELLMRVHHRNLTSLIGYCNDGTNMGLIYEFMANGNLRDHLSGGNALNWEERLQIAIDAAQGLEYMHSGCKPPIIHRDVKSANILLNKEFQAKLGDFGLCRIFPSESDSHVSTRVIGTPGYLDPEYYTSNRLTEKSDVFSFGIVLLEIITGQPATSKDPEKSNIVHWVRKLLENGDIRNIMDPRLNGAFEISSIWRTVDLGVACVSSGPAERPTMNYVVMELKECLALERRQRPEGRGNDTGLVNSREMATRDSLTSPLPR